MLKSVPILCGTLLIVSIQSAPSAQMTFRDDGTRLLVLDREKPVLGYYYGPVGPGEAPRHSHFIYPLYDMSGESIAVESGESDGHSGLFWAWGNCQVGERPLDIWAGTSGQRVFERWLGRSTSDDRADIALQSVWIFSDTGAAQVIETTYLTVWSEKSGSRSVDISIFLRNVSYETLLIGGVDGAQGFCLRLSPDLRGLSISGGKGLIMEGVTSIMSPWLDLSYRNPRHSTYSGLAIFQHPKNPGYSGRNWHFGADGLIGAGLPGSERLKLKPGQGVHFRYRLYFHRGYGPDQALEQPYAAYLLGLSDEDGGQTSNYNSRNEKG